MTYANSICNIMGTICIVSGISILIVNSPVNSVLWLIVAFVSAACYLIAAGMTFIGLSYVIVYVGAIAVLFLFVVMILNIANLNLSIGSEGSEGNNDKKSSSLSLKTGPLAFLILIIGIITIYQASANVNSAIYFNLPLGLVDSLNDLLYGQSIIIESPSISVSNIANNWDVYSHNINSMNQVQVLGITLYTHGALWLLMISVLLLLAIIVPLALAFTV